jgi:muramidase (phage lysozyme)
VLVGLAALVLWTQARAGQVGPENDPWRDWGPGEGEGTMPSETDPLSALLYAIRTAEHGSWKDDGLRYFTFYGGAAFAGLTDHPVATGELKGVRLPDRYCRAAGLRPGCVSTAAGAYQIILPTWRRVREAGRWGPRLVDFSIDSQDEAARRILEGTGALRLLAAGDIEGAIRRAATQWASLPGSTSGQPQRTMAEVLAWYRQGIEAQG